MTEPLAESERGWRARALCLGSPTWWWFPTNAVQTPGRALCARCPVSEQCLAEELAVMRAGRGSYGLRGGTDASERWTIVLGGPVRFRHGRASVETRVVLGVGR